MRVETTTPRRFRVLVVDDERAMAEMVADGLVDAGYDAQPLSSASAALARLDSEPVDAVVTDLRMEPLDGFAVLAHSRRLDPTRPVIIMTAYSAIDSAVEAIRRGAHHYLSKPFPLDELCIFLRRALDERQLRRDTDSLRRALGVESDLAGMVGKSDVMQRLFAMVDRVASTDVSVLVVGETGTGKGRIAALLHARSHHAAGPFVVVNCAALPEQLLESELFGHVLGAFTGATSSRVGLFAEADGGTLFLDEIGDVPLALQAKLLHALERRTIRPVGGDHERAINVRIVAATHRDLHADVRDGRFREDLLYRLQVVTLEIPPLRDRPEDIPALAALFLREARQRYLQAIAEVLSREAMTALLEHHWPGNVRELSHVLERTVLLSGTQAITADDLPPQVRRRTPLRERAIFNELMSLRELQQLYVTWAFEQLGKNRTRTAERLDIDYKTLLRWLRAPKEEGGRE